jgi:hypothetical protein
MKELTVLTKRHRLFVEAYVGDVISAMVAAGFTGTPEYLKQEGDKLLSNELILNAIKERSRYMAKTFQVVADREERKATLTALMRNEDPHWKEEKDQAGIPVPTPNIPVATRLKAIELLGKAEGDFTEHLHITGNIGITELVTDSYKVTQTADEIEAEFKLVEEKGQNPFPETAPTPAKFGEYL